MKSILDPSFNYTDSASTDIRKLFDRVRKEQAEKKKVHTQPPPEAKVTAITRRNAK